MRDLAYLAHYMGYAWCAGCRGQYVGEDFRKDGDSWKADQSHMCSGHKWQERLEIAYGDWDLIISDMAYGDTVLTDLVPETIDEGQFTNNLRFPTTQVVERETQVTRSVSHTDENTWTHNVAAEITVAYSPPDATGGPSSSFTFTYGHEWGSTTINEEGEEDVETFSTSAEVTIEPYSSIGFRLILLKTKRTLPYTATILISFSVELKGFMRWGGNGGTTNFHIDEHGSDNRNTIHYKFGDESVPFYEDLKDKSDQNELPWMWEEMRATHPSVQSYIDDLQYESRYQFELRGKFDDVSGKEVIVEWFELEDKRDIGETAVAASEEVDRGVIKVVAKQLPTDPTSPDVEFPEPEREVHTSPDLPDVRLSEENDDPVADL